MSHERGRRAAGTQGADGAELHLLTLNLWGLPWPVAGRRRERKRRFAAHVLERAYDLVGIQELWWPWRRSLRLARLRLPGSRRDSGLALAARLRLHEGPRVEAFRARAGVDALKRKGVLRAAVEAGGTALSVFVTHLQAGRRHATVRARQVDQVLEALGRERGPAVLMGDFNLHRDVAEDRRSGERLESGGLLDVARALRRDEPTYPSARPGAARERFDRVYVRSVAQLRLEPLEIEVLRAPRPFSDHHPLRARLRLAR